MKIAVNTAKLLRNVPLPDEIATVHDNAVVMDMGSSQTRLGFSGDDAPRLVQETVVGMDPATNHVECMGNAFKKRESLKIKRVLKGGRIARDEEDDAARRKYLDKEEKKKEYTNMAAMLRHVDDLLGMSKDPNTPLLISEAALVPKEQREQMVELLFEDIGVHALYFAPSPVLSLYASGRTSGMVIEMGNNTCHTVPIFEGLSLFHSVLELDFGGDDLTNFMGKHIAAQNPQLELQPFHQYEVWQYLKELHCPVMADRGAFATVANDSNKSDVVHYTLPDNTTVTLGNDRYVPTESFFQPGLLGFSEERSLPNLAVESIRKCDADIAAMLYGNIVLSGGGSLFNGLPDRLNRELQERTPREKIRIFAATERRQATWVGGSILSSLPTFQDMWVTKAEYEETGPDTRNSIAHRNCF